MTIMLQRLVLCGLALLVAIPPAVVSQGLNIEPTVKPPVGGVGPRLQLDPNTYNPRGKDWATVVSACRAIGALEKRIFNQIIRATFHDAMTVDPSECADPDGCRVAADGSLILTDEVDRPENQDFAARVSTVIFKVADFCRVSVADTLAVCGAVAIEEHSGKRFKILGPGGVPNFPVGRIDNINPNVADTLPRTFADPVEFAGFWRERNFTMTEAMALMGSHSLDPRQGCWRGAGSTLRKCNPNRGFRGCQDIRMFRWENHFFQDMVPGPGQDILHPPLGDGLKSDPDIAELSKQGKLSELARIRTEEKCRWSSTKFRNRFTNMFDTLVKEANSSAPPTLLQKINTDLSSLVIWVNSDACASTITTPDPLCAPSGNTRRTWLYTSNDAQMAQIIKTPEGPEEVNTWTSSIFSFAPQGTPRFDEEISNMREIRSSVRTFAGNQGIWDGVTKDAYIKMVSKFARWSKLAGPNGHLISGLECNSLYTIDSWCAFKANKLFILDCSLCSPDGRGCDPCCRCSTSFVGGRARRFSAKK